jgi:spore germination cell wall hydrolase CwlJ-like protein
MTDTSASTAAHDRAMLRKWALPLAGLLLAVLAVVLLALYGAREPDTPVEKAARAKSVDDLPALPEEIAAHGEDAKSLLAPGDARARNEAVPFAAAKLDLARPFAFKGSDEDRARAVQCLAAAVLYEAGDDARGQRAVAQVVLNRVRHAAFPSTICGVVYQGAERKTGCQFTFTCDGSLRRIMPDAMWERARVVARQALGGHVEDAVGLATHYHTDWVYPYWSPSLRKLARVDTHLFFGWPGRWGGPAAFTRTYRGGEKRTSAALPDTATEAEIAAAIDPEAPKILGLPQARAELPEGMAKVPLYGNRVRLVGADGRSFGLLAPVGIAPARLVNAALALCEKPGPCRVNAWSNEDDIPGQYPLPEGAKGTMVFEFARSSGIGQGTLRFDCERFPNKDPNRCFSPRVDPAEVLSGVRFKAR